MSRRVWSIIKGSKGDDLSWKNWGYEVTCDYVTISGTAAQLLRTFSAVAKRKGMKCEYTNARQLANRIKDSKSVLEDKNIKLITESNRTNTIIYKFNMNCR